MRYGILAVPVLFLLVVPSAFSAHKAKSAPVTGTAALPEELNIPLPDLPDNVALPAPAQAASTATAVPAGTPSASADTPTPVTATAEPTPMAVETATATPTAVSTDTPVPAATQPAPAASGPALEDWESYWPLKAGARWSYASPDGKHRTLECVSRSPVEGGAVAEVKLTEGDAVSTESWKVAGGKVALGAAAGGLRAGWVRLLKPVGKTVPRWTYDRLNGTMSYYKQEAGSVKVGGKTYADAQTVTERTLKGTQDVGGHRWVYAQGVGLVADETLDAEKKPVAASSFTLESPAQP